MTRLKDYADNHFMTGSSCDCHSNATIMTTPTLEQPFILKLAGGVPA